MSSEPTAPSLPARKTSRNHLGYMKYLELVKSKGAFKDQTEGTPEYAQTMEKVKTTYMEKFEPKKPQLSMGGSSKGSG